MPVLSMFYGIIVRMYKELGGRHNAPHLHASYSGEEVVMNFDGEIIEGALPRKQIKLLEAWITIHQDELKANWEIMSTDGQPFKIDPLK